MTSLVSRSVEEIRSLGHPRVVRVTLLTAGGILAGAVIGRFIAAGQWYVALGLILLVPGVMLLHRYRLAVIAIWLLAAPFVIETDSGAVRKLFWVLHRGLPLAAVIVIGLGILSDARRRRIRLGWPEVLMAGYVVASLVSIATTSADPLTTAYLFYDRVFIPMCLYLLIRLVEPEESDVKRLIPVAAFILLTQTAVGILSWIVPGALPTAWLGLAGARTTGSLVHPNVFAVTLLFCGMLALHGALSVPRRPSARWALIGLFVLSLIMVFLTFSRASWLAGIVVIGGLAFVYPRAMRRLVAVAVPILAVVLVTGAISGTGEIASDRFLSESSEESALSRLPVALASVRMFSEKPLVGWGYENFNVYDRRFQETVGGYFPDKDTSSHNVYLTLLAEQGILGLVLFLGPAIWWLVRTPSALRNMPTEGFLSRRLLIILWLVMATFFTVNQFSNMRVTFGLGVWWVTLGMIAALVDRHRRPGPAPNADAPLEAAALGGGR
jgi:O-antigen ligase